MEPLVSIRIPCYNHEEFINDCLTSIYYQTYKNIEVILIDDCSSDCSFEIALSWKERFEKRFKRVVFLKNKENLGITKNIVKLLSLCEGEYIKGIASDDFLLPDAIEKYVSFIRTHDADIVFSNAYVIKECDKYNDINSLSALYHNSLPPSGRNLTKKLLKESFICAPTAFIPQKTYEQFGYYDTRFAFEDWEYWLRVSVQGCIEYMDTPTIAYRVSESSYSHFLPDKNGRERHKKYYFEKVKILEKYIEFADREIVEYFFNNQFREALVLYDKQLCKDILKICKEKKLIIDKQFLFKYYLLILGIFPYIRRINKRVKTRLGMKLYG